MAPDLPLDPETLSQLRSLRTFILNLPGPVVKQNELIQSLLHIASEAFVWPQPKGARSKPYPKEFITPERGRFRLDVSKVVLAGAFAPFWHLDNRGSIALRVTRLPRTLDEFFKQCPLHPGCTEPSIFSSRNTLKKGFSQGAIRYCEEVIDNGEYAFLLPSGLGHVSLFAPESELVRLYQLAHRNCRPWNCNNTYFTLSQSHLYS